MRPLKGGHHGRKPNLKFLPLRALAASTGKDLPLIKKYYETAADAAKAYKVNLEETYTAADSLAQLYGPEAANGMIAGVAQAAAATHQSVAATAEQQIQLRHSFNLTFRSADPRAIAPSDAPE
jgi:hypothetical protein